MSARGAAIVRAQVTQARPRRARGLRLPRPHATRYQLALGCLLCLVLAFYLWTAASSLPFQFTAPPTDVYNELATGFLHGHTYLPLTPPSGLIHLANPYNPALNTPYRIAYHDLAYYRGHFYSAWGPTPVITLFAPFRITGLVMPESFAVALYGFIGLLCAVLLLHALVARLLPRTPKWALLLGTVALALGNVVPFLARRPVQYEVAISCGYCFLMAGLWLVVTAALTPRLRPVRLAIGSLCLGLAIGGRPDLAVAGVVPLAVAAREIRRRRVTRGLRGLRLPDGALRVLLCALGPFIACCLLLALYNDVRFHSLGNFGDRYQLANIDQETAKFFSLTYVPPGMLSYLVVPARLALTFPHAFLQTAAADPISLPAGYMGSSTGPSPAEPAGGLLTTVPITLALLALPLLWWRCRGHERPVLLAATGLALLGLAIAAVLSWSVFGTTQRYEVDFATPVVIAGVLVWTLLLQRGRARRAVRTAWAVLGILAILFGAFVGAAVSLTGYSDLLRLQHPGTFEALEDVTAPAATLATVIRGKPEIARVDNGPLSVGELPTGTTEAGSSAWLGRNPVTLVVLSPGRRWIGITATITAGPQAPRAPQRLRIHVAGHRILTMPVRGGLVRLPAFVHWGLNRVRVSLAGNPGADEEFQLGNLQLAS